MHVALLVATTAQSNGCPVGNVFNRILVADIATYPPLPGLTLVADDGRDVWQPPVPVVVPGEVTMFQLQEAMLATPSHTGVAGKTVLDDVNAWAALTPGLLQRAWAKASTLERNGPVVAQLAAGLGLSSAQLDALFVLAGSITA